MILFGVLVPLDALPKKKFVLSWATLVLKYGNFGDFSQIKKKMVSIEGP